MHTFFKKNLQYKILHSIIVFIIWEANVSVQGMQLMLKICIIQMKNENRSFSSINFSGNHITMAEIALQNSH